MQQLFENFRREQSSNLALVSSGQQQKKGKTDEAWRVLVKMGNELIGDVFEDVRVIRYGTIEKILDKQQTFLGCGSVVDVPVVE